VVIAGPVLNALEHCLGKGQNDFPFAHLHRLTEACWHEVESGSNRGNQVAQASQGASIEAAERDGVEARRCGRGCQS
jgi:hypothetical protein